MNMDVHRHVWMHFVTRITSVSKSNQFFYDLNGYKNSISQIAKTNNLKILKKDGSLKYPGNDCGLSNQTWFNCTNGFYFPKPENLRKVLIALHTSFEQAQEIMAFLGASFSNCPYDKAFVECLKNNNYENWFDVANYIVSKTGLYLEESA